MTIEIPDDFLESRLKGIFKKAGEPYVDLIVGKILDNLKTTEMGISQLIQAFHGYEYKSKYVIGDEVKVRVKDLHSWYIEKPEMEAAGLIVDGLVKAKITEIMPTKRDNLRIEFRRVWKDALGVCTEDDQHQDIKEDEVFVQSDCMLVVPRNLAELL